MHVGGRGKDRGPVGRSRRFEPAVDAVADTGWSRRVLSLCWVGSARGDGEFERDLEREDRGLLSLVWDRGDEGPAPGVDISSSASPSDVSPGRRICLGRIILRFIVGVSVGLASFSTSTTKLLLVEFGMLFGARNRDDEMFLNPFRGRVERQRARYETFGNIWLTLPSSRSAAFGGLLWPWLERDQ
jgi:hypothetical protein